MPDAAWVRSWAERPSVSYTKVTSKVARTGKKLQITNKFKQQIRGEFMRSGVGLVGEHPVSPIFPQDQIYHYTRLLLKTAAWRNQTMAALPIHSEELELAAKLWEVTNQEVQRGFVEESL